MIRNALLRGICIGTATLATGLPAARAGEDCNNNGIPDSVDIMPTLDFGAGLNYLTAPIPSSPGIGDINNDGLLDAAVTSISQDYVAIVFGQPDGSFTFPITEDTLGRPTGVALGDFDGDLDLDCVTADRDDATISLIRNDANTSFQRIAGLNLVGVTMTGVVGGRFNNDTNDDFILMTSTGFQVFLGDGTPFGFNSLPPQALSGTVAGAAVEDIDGDLDLDFVGFIPNTNTVVIARNDGTGVFTTTTFAAGGVVNGVALGQLTGSALPDLVTTLGFDGNAEQYTNMGGGVFAIEDTFPAGDRPSHAVIADLDGDADNDLAVSYAITGNPNRDNVRVFRNEAGVLTQYSSAMTARFSRFVVAADNDDDNDNDLLVFALNGTITALDNDGAGNFPGGPSRLEVANAFAVVARDLDGDLDTDLAVARTTGFVDIYRYDPPNYSLIDSEAVGGQPVALHAVLLNDDSTIDLVTANNDDGTISVLFGNPDGTFQPAVTIPVDVEVTFVTSADFDQDMDMDIAVTYPGIFESGAGGGCNCYMGGGAVYVFKNDGMGGLSLFETIPTGDGTFGVAAADLDNDLFPEIVVANRDQSDVRIHFNNGDATFTSTSSFLFGPGAISVELADFDGNGTTDIAAGRFELNELTDESVLVLLNDGSANFTPSGPFPASAGTVDLVSADLDDDGDRDLVFGGIFSGDASVLPNLGDGTFGPPINNHIGDGAIRTAIADRTGNGTLDLLVVGLSGQVVFLENDFLPAASLDENDNGIPDECETLPGDMNCDGAVSVGDINPFVLALTDPAGYAAMFPDCNILNGDCSDDGLVTVGDINCFVALVTGG